MFTSISKPAWSIVVFLLNLCFAVLKKCSGSVFLYLCVVCRTNLGHVKHDLLAMEQDEIQSLEQLLNKVCFILFLIEFTLQKDTLLLLIFCKSLLFNWWWCWRKFWVASRNCNFILTEAAFSELNPLINQLVNYFSWNDSFVHILSGMICSQPRFLFTHWIIFVRLAEHYSKKLIY